MDRILAFVVNSLLVITNPDKVRLYVDAIFGRHCGEGLVFSKGKVNRKVQQVLRNLHFVG